MSIILICFCGVLSLIMSASVRSTVHMVSATGGHVQQGPLFVEIVGHSFPRRVDDYLRSTNSNLLNLSQAQIIWRYRGGMRIPNLRDFEGQWLNGRPDVIVIDIGSNDIANLNGRAPNQMALELVLMMQKIQQSISCEVLCRTDVPKSRISSSNALCK